MQIEAIAHIHTSFPEKFGIPRQSGLVPEAEGRIVFAPKYRQPDALRGIEEYSHLWLLWDFSENHKKDWAATVAPPRLGGRERRGVFATRSPFRPNPLGLSCVELKAVLSEEEGPVLLVSGVDMLDGTPIYDIKPYLPYADAHPEARGGFTDALRGHVLSVEFPEELRSGLSEKTYAALCGILSQDPRTAFIHDEERIWGISYEGLNVRFTVDGDKLKVVELTPLTER
ncbi:MAG: tRNA (N6-threonylcarbamoyladenosine(37)-N6)-methyltransferase TrmO [Lachnospiraceae bacterium]|nr:tRNA (N6-threonylcarbamoyladenosine(37)-N6)-methyltransferase TrmO [Lachnospiraceae bacterium]